MGTHACTVVQSCPTLCDPVDCSPPGSSVRGMSQARIPVRVATSYSKGSSCPRVRTRVSCVSCTGRRVLSAAPPGTPFSPSPLTVRHHLGTVSALRHPRPSPGEDPLSRKRGKDQSLTRPFSSPPSEQNQTCGLRLHHAYFNEKSHGPLTFASRMYCKK